MLKPKSKTSGTVIKPLRIAEDLHNEISRVGEVTGLNEADTMRQAIERGLPIVEQLLTPERKKKAA